jgi:hypothetical protein
MTPNHKPKNVIKGRIVEDLQMNPAEVSMRFSDGSTMHVKVMESNSPPLIKRTGRAFARSPKNQRSHPIGISVKAQKSGWHGSLTLSLDKGEKKKDQTNRIQVHYSATALQSDSAASDSKTCAPDRRGFHGAILQCVESRSEYALCATDSCHRFERHL